jgi:predicted GNAT family acetyltransferase
MSRDVMTSRTVPVQVTHNIDLQRFEVQADEHVAFLTYKHDGARVIMDHTYVPEELRGRGLANTLGYAALEEAQRQGWIVVPRCSFVAAFIERNPKFANLVGKL